MQSIDGAFEESEENDYSARTTWGVFDVFNQENDLTANNGYKVRNLLDSEPYQRIFPKVRLSQDKQGKSDWATNHGGEFYAIGVGGGVTGRRAHGALLDDLVKDRKDADSIVIRDSTWDWYKTAMRTRLRKDGWIVFVNTRWHEDDPAGRILPEHWAGESGWVTDRFGEQWYVIRLPAIAEENDQLGRKPGEALWPEEKSLAALRQEEVILGKRDWNALYQQHGLGARDDARALGVEAFGELKERAVDVEAVGRGRDQSLKLHQHRPRPFDAGENGRTGRFRMPLAEEQLETDLVEGRAPVETIEQLAALPDRAADRHFALHHVEDRPGVDPRRHARLVLLSLFGRSWRELVGRSFSIIVDATADLIGFGRSDKLTRVGSYSFAFHYERLERIDHKSARDVVTEADHLSETFRSLSYQT